jgi:metal-sulfur cluster biosynthetic enzyme
MSSTDSKAGSASNTSASTAPNNAAEAGAPKADGGSADLQQTKRKIFDELTKIVDPEIGVSIMELELVDKVDINSGKVAIDLHLTSPFCPAVFGFKIAQDVRDNIYKLPGINDVKVQVSNHFMADAINKQVNESKYPAKPQQQAA